VTFTFEIASPKFGRFDVVAPACLRAEIDSYAWYVKFEPRRSAGRQFIAGANRETDGRRKPITLHQFVWSLLGNDLDGDLDHIDGNPLNNSENNLRAVPHWMNCINRKSARTDSVSGVRGVQLRTDKKTPRWIARIKVKGKKIHLGTFRSEAEASAAWVTAFTEITGATP